MTVVNIKGWGSSLKDLDKFILMALFKGKLDSTLQPHYNTTFGFHRNRPCHE